MCPRCGFSGMISAYERKTGLSFCFRCPCKYAEEKRISTSINVWSDRCLERFTLNQKECGHENGAHHAPPVPENHDVPTVKKDYKVLAADPHAYDDED